MVVSMKVLGPEVHFLLLVTGLVLQLKVRDDFRELLSLVLEKSLLHSLFLLMTVLIIIITIIVLILIPMLVVVNRVDHRRKPVVVREFFRMFV